MRATRSTDDTDRTDDRDTVGDATGTARRLAMAAGGGLLMLALPVCGLVNVLAGAETPLYAYELPDGSTGNAIAPGVAPEGAEIVGQPLVDPNLRATLVVAGLLVWATYGAYALFQSPPATGPTSERDDREPAGTAD